MGDRSPAFQLIVNADPASRPDPGGPQPLETLGDRARQLASMSRFQVLRTLETSSRGLTEAEADIRATVYGENTLSPRQSTARWRRGAAVAGNPFVVLLIALGVV